MKRKMHDITNLPAWERLFKKIVWKQLGDMEGKKILDFGSGEGITANHFAEKNDVTAIEPSKKMLSNAWKDYEYTQIVGDVNALSAFKNETFDMIICHNVLEYIDDKTAVVKALARVLKKDSKGVYREVESEGSRRQNLEPMNKNWLKGA